MTQQKKGTAGTAPTQQKTAHPHASSVPPVYHKPGQKSRGNFDGELEEGYDLLDELPQSWRDYFENESRRRAVQRGVY